jgi:hypothetical protein
MATGRLSSIRAWLLFLATCFLSWFIAEMFSNLGSLLFEDAPSITNADSISQIKDNEIVYSIHEIRWKDNQVNVAFRLARTKDGEIGCSFDHLWATLHCYFLDRQHHQVNQPIPHTFFHDSQFVFGKKDAEVIEFSITPPGRAAYISVSYEDSLWHTRPIRLPRPSVYQEVRHWLDSVVSGHSP